MIVVFPIPSVFSNLISIVFFLRGKAVKHIIKKHPKPTRLSHLTENCLQKFAPPH